MRARSTPALCAIVAFVCLGAAFAAPAATLTPTADVMVSPFFSGTDRLRGFAADNRDVHRVSTPNPFGTVGAEVIYIAFDPGALQQFTGAVTAALTVTSAPGGFGADAAPGTPFTVSAHAVDGDPLALIIDDDVASGSVDWLTFYNDYTRPADPAAVTAVDAFGLVSFDVSAIVNDWIAGTNATFVIALTGLNDTSGNAFLHGFVNASEQAGATFLTVTAVPLPAAAWLFALPGVCVLLRRSRGPRRDDR